MNLNVKEIYKDYLPKTQEYMQNVIDCLKQDYKEIPSSWRISLDLIADNYDLYLKAKEDLDKTGLQRETLRRGFYKNPNYQIMNQSQNMVINLLKQFKLTPMSKGKLKEYDASKVTVENLLS